MGSWPFSCTFGRVIGFGRVIFDSFCPFSRVITAVLVGSNTWKKALPVLVGSSCDFGGVMDPTKSE